LWADRTREVLHDESLLAGVCLSNFASDVLGRIWQGDLQLHDRQGL
jgi:hypothetical protein